MCAYVQNGIPHVTTRMLDVERADANGDYQQVVIRRQGCHPLTLVNAYCPPIGGVRDARTNSFAAAMAAMPTERVVIAGDLNARHQDWCVKGLNRSGSLVRDWARRNDFRVCNIRTCPTRITAHDGASSPDVVLCSGEPDVEVSHWEILPDVGSDHLPMWFELPGAPSVPAATLRWIIAKADRAKFSLAVMEHLAVVDASASLDAHCTAVTSAIWTAAELAIPRRCPKVWWKPWWNADTQEAIETRRAAKCALADRVVRGEDTAEQRAALRCHAHPGRGQRAHRRQRGDAVRLGAVPVHRHRERALRGRRRVL